MVTTAPSVTDAISYFTDVDPWHVSLRPGESTATQGRAVRPDLTLRCSFADWADMTAGRTDPRKLMLSRRLRPKGHLRILLALPKVLG